MTTKEARDQLTAQELQIAQLAAGRPSNREIGQRLYFPRITCCPSRAFSRDFYEFAVLREVWIGACRKIEAAGSSFAGSEFRDAHFDASPACLGVLRRVNPAHPFPTCHGRDVLPEFG